MISFLSGLPTVLVVLLVLTFWVGLSAGGLLVVRRFIPHPILREHNDVAGFIFAAVGVVYAVILAFVVIAIWESYEEDRENVNREAATMVNLYREMAPFADADKRAVREEIQTYVTEIVEHEWSMMQKGNRSDRTELALEELWASVQAIEPTNATQSAWYDSVIETLGELSALRQERLESSWEGMPWVMTGLLSLGGMITIAYTYLYGVRNLYGQLAMTSALAATIALAMALVVVLDMPFRGDTAIDSEPFIESLELIESSGLN